MTEVEELKTQLISILMISNEAAEITDPINRRSALEHMQRTIQEAKPILTQYAVDLMVGSDEHPEAWRP